MTNKISVKDQIMGFGKTTNAMNEMNEQIGKKYVFASPYKKEVDRVVDGVKDAVQPLENKGSKGSASKTHNLKKLLGEGSRVIVMTHELFKRMDQECIELITEQGYCLKFDEALDLIEVSSTIPEFDLQVFLGCGILTVCGLTGQVEWTWEGAYPKSLYPEKELRDLQKLCDQGALYYMPKTEEDGSQNCLFRIFPQRIFEAFIEVEILTYNFEGSAMDAYFKISGFDVEYAIRTELEEARHTKLLQQALDLITIYDHTQIQDIEHLKMSHGGYGKEGKESKPTTENLDKIGRAINGFFKHIGSTKNMWTSRKDLRYDISHKTPTGKKSKGKARFDKMNPQDYNEDKNPGFLATGSKATNDYSNKTACAYVYDKYLNPDIQQFFKMFGVTVDQDVVALNDLIQWIWRSAIRNNEPIDVFIPKVRMRNLFKKWLGIDQEPTVKLKNGVIVPNRYKKVA